ncbi:MAG: radical SAM protein [Fibrobacter sp.]|nr:radical SAM protein [Fibrobacter sp.]
MSRKLYLINPKSHIEGYLGASIFRVSGTEPVVYVTNLATTTIASLAKSFMDVSICEEEVSQIDYETDAEFIGITGNASQSEGMLRISGEFRKRGKIVIMEGPFASLNADYVRPHCDILVHGEIENICGELFSDLIRNSWKKEYFGTPSDLSDSPVPDLTNYPNSRTILGAIQISRGCPCDCEFCEAVRFSGTKQRYKPVDRIARELDNVFTSGYSDIVIVDDNITADKEKAQSALNTLIDWNTFGSNKKKVSFSTRLRIDTAGDDEMLDLMAKASIDLAFIGLEPGQKDFVGIDAKISKFLQYGIQPTCGITIGSDTDDVNTFKQIRDVFESLPIPIYAISGLMAFKSTRLYARLAAEERIRPGDSTNTSICPAGTNIILKRMSQEEFDNGVKWLCSNLYNPPVFCNRVSKMLDDLNYETRPWYLDKTYISPNYERKDRKWIMEQSFKVIRFLYGTGEAERKLVTDLQKISEAYPYKAPLVNNYLIRYAQVRHYFNQLGIYEAALFDRTGTF